MKRIKFKFPKTKAKKHREWLIKQMEDGKILKLENNNGTKNK